MENRFSNSYAVVDLETGRCNAVVLYHDTVNMADHIAVPCYDPVWIGKYYYDWQWWERVWNEYGEDGLPVEAAGYIDTLFQPNV